MRPSEALALHLDEVRSIIARYPVSNPRIFGSVARGEDREGSDLDILVDHDGQVSTFELAELELALEGLLSARVEIKTAGDLSGDVAQHMRGDLREL